MIKGGIPYTWGVKAPRRQKINRPQLLFSSPTSSSSSSSPQHLPPYLFLFLLLLFTPADMSNNCSEKARAESRNIGVQCCFPEAEAEEKQCERCSGKKPQFFKVLFENFRDSLKIPPAFLKHLRIGESGAAIVKDHAGRSWDVKLLRMGDHIIFEEGWKKFVEENGLDTNDFLVFRYDGELHFTVTIFDKSCVEKSPPTPTTPTADVIADEDHLQSVDVDMEEKCTTLTADDHLQSVDVDMEEKCTRSKAWDVASSLKTSNPTFKKMVAESDSHRMRIPANAPNGSVPKKTCEVKLEDPDGRQWPVKFLLWISSNKAHSLPRMERTLSSGWHNFFEANFLKKGDVCVFEFVAQKKLFSVHIFRDGT